MAFAYSGFLNIQFIIMIDLDQQLKNPVWYALKETHKKFAIEFDGVQFYDPEICTFGAFFEEEKTAKASSEYSKKCDKFFFVSEDQTPLIDNNKVRLEKKIDGCQMVLNTLTDVLITEQIVLLDETHLDEIYDLIWMVMPGFYQKRTFNMGKYFGVFKDGKLVSIAGQRMQTNLFIEVSAVVTHPNYTRKGLSKQLISHVTKDILKENKTPILHTNKGNLAISIYEKLGYKLTRDMNWWLYNKK
ncbi:GNAT family N-acetyltransferase [Formosa algae]|uniref:GNAT superfamily N-acetyltransferase n=2 Tax=Formosa algae TaxID=225843 RepID=A0A9X0YKW4_9FLAO|nr:GNAT family N-acetyltransferase [Formosa algae]MBP1840430.1 GNAT superfamily N-acetyltransferase [Formosa algae]MDQ0336922.1 GNAT superfamily N-acetyltransferase [Formosa algae]